MSNDALTVPSLYIKRRDETTTKAELRLTSARDRFLVRFTGGCGYMSVEDAQDLNSLFTEAFHGFAGAMLFGGTRMINKQDPTQVLPMITEVPPLIRKANPGSSLLGIIPRSQDLKLSPMGLIVNDEENSDYVTIVHPDQDQCLVVQQSADEGIDWEAEFNECLRITDDLRTFAHWDSLLVCYNGGSITEKEILATAERSWPILLVNGSGRKTEEYANKAEFLRTHKNVWVADRNVGSIRAALVEVGALVGVPASIRPRLYIVGEKR